MLIRTPSRREFLRYAGLSAGAARCLSGQLRLPGIASPPASASIAFVIAGTIVGDGSTLTLNTSGGNFIYFGGSYHPAVPVSITDNKSNSYTALTAVGGSASPDSRSYYCKAATCGTSHIFTIHGLLPGGFVMVFSGVSTSAPLDVENHANDITGTSVQPGSVTASASNSLYCCTINGDIGAVVSSINSSFTIAANQAGVGGTGYGSTGAWKVGSGAENPAWSTNSAQYDNSIAVFK